MGCRQSDQTAVKINLISKAEVTCETQPRDGPSVFESTYTQEHRAKDTHTDVVQTQQSDAHMLEEPDSEIVRDSPDCRHRVC